MSEARQIHCTYADDLRREVSSRLTIVGAYQDPRIPVSSGWPLTLHKLCILVDVTTSIENPIRHAELKILLDKEALHTFELPDGVLQLSDDPPAGGRPATKQGVRVALEFVNFQVAREGEINAVLVADGEELKGNGLFFFDAERKSHN